MVRGAQALSATEAARTTGQRVPALEGSPWTELSGGDGPGAVGIRIIIT